MCPPFLFLLYNLSMTILKFFLPHPALAQQTKEWADIQTSSGKACVINDVATLQGFECIFYNILQVITFFAGVAFFIMFIYGGYQYLFSSNDPKKTAVASSTLTMAIVGIIGVIGSWLIMSTIKKFTGVDVTNFSIPGWK